MNLKKKEIMAYVSFVLICFKYVITEIVVFLLKAKKMKENLQETSPPLKDLTSMKDDENKLGTTSV